MTAPTHDKPDYVKSVVAGVDLGGRRARICLLDPLRPSEPTWWGFEPLGKPGHVEAARRAGEWARLHFAAPGCPHVSVCWFERPFGRFPEVNFQLSLLAGALLGAVPVATSVEFVSATECRRLCEIPARAKKDEIMEWAGNELEMDGFVFDEHAADAYVVARAVLAFGAKEMTG